MALPSALIVNSHGIILDQESLMTLHRTFVSAPKLNVDLIFKFHLAIEDLLPWLQVLKEF